MRPELCRLCERPAADGGHRATELDLDKLTKWCLVNLGTTLTGGVKDDDFFCCFCVWDAKFQFENEAQNSNGNNDLQWWPSVDPGNNKILFETYSKGLVQQSWVSLEKIKLNNPESEESVLKEENRGQKCVYCRKTFKQLFYHIKRNHADIAIRCNYNKHCVTYYKSYKLRDAHIKEVHLKPKVKRIMDCIYCPKRNLQLRNLYTHMRENHSKIAIRCKVPNCVIYFLTKEELEVHTKEKHRNLEKRLIFKCSECAFKAPCGINLSNHLATVHQIGVKLIQCEKCPSTFVSDLGYRRHVYTRHNFKTCLHCNTEVLMLSFAQHTTAVKCLKCELDFNCRGLLKSHKQKHHSHNFKAVSQNSNFLFRRYKRKMYKCVIDKTNREIFQCKLCPSSFLSVIGHQRHFKSIHLSYKYRCGHCSAEYWGRDNMKNHLSMKHDLIDKNYKCEKCNLSFFLLKNFREHQQKTKFNCQNTVKCGVCKELVYRPTLSKHMLIEHGAA
ncbi:zinc finger protein 423 homolog [Neocloeon triangulifer]|uniref:zinc finger protein 423 homolog n=1 Tax=Neocloeon triangulifer TaxID=2078957 RepID=UPI00286EED78|nr:zinc finger protein 423 homolog [Neocloeon triangulifer]